MCCAQAAAEAYIYTTRATSPVMKSGFRCVRFISGERLKGFWRILEIKGKDTLRLFKKGFKRLHPCSSATGGLVG